MKITLEEALQKSKKALKEGRINDAVRIYRAIATVQRHHSVIEKEVRFALKKDEGSESNRRIHRPAREVTR